MEYGRLFKIGAQTLGWAELIESRNKKDSLTELASYGCGIALRELAMQIIAIGREIEIQQIEHMRQKNKSPRNRKKSKTRRTK